MSNSMRFLGAAALVAAAGSVALGCGGQPEFAEQPAPPDAGVDAAPPPPPPVVDAGPPPVAVGPCDPVITLAMTTTFAGRQVGEAPGMQLEGGLSCGTVPEGQTMTSTTFMLQPGHCYTFLAQGMPSVTEVDMLLVPDLTGGAQQNPAVAALLRGPALAIDTDSGVQATIGLKQNCYKNPLPFQVPAKLEVKARIGSGPVASQVYKKKTF